MLMLGLVPFSNQSKPGDDVNWYLVLFDKWINLGRKFNYKYFTYITCSDGFFGFKCHWLKPNKPNRDYFAIYKQVPWSKMCYERGYLIKGQWVWLEDDDLNMEAKDEIYKKSDTYTTKFILVEDNKRTRVETTVKAEGRRFAPICLKPYWLKTLYCNLFKSEIKEVEIRFSTDIGEGRGTWKGGMGRTYYPFMYNLMLSWVDFKNEKLGEILNGQKFI